MDANSEICADDTFCSCAFKSWDLICYRNTGKNQILGTACFFVQESDIPPLYSGVENSQRNLWVILEYFRIWLNPRRQATFWKVNMNIPQSVLAELLVFTVWFSGVGNKMHESFCHIHLEGGIMSPHLLALLFLLPSCSVISANCTGDYL